MSIKAPFAYLPLVFLASCQDEEESDFPKAHRPVAPIVSDAFSTEDARDRVGEAEAVIDFAGVKPGMSVADIGAGEGYYTVRLSPVVGSRGRVLAQDIVPQVRDRLAQRVQREGLDNVAVRLGLPADPKLPPNSFDLIFLVHMYHEVTEPYEFLWNLRPALKKDGFVVVVDADRDFRRHGTPPRLLDCEFGAIGFTRLRRQAIVGTDSYIAVFKATAPRPRPQNIKACASE
jgi:ubiquinone/menaquinone biosynthesis C-methylase UbiE